MSPDPRPCAARGAQTITIRVDDAPCTLPAGCVLADVPAALGHASHAVATAVNGRFVAREARDAWTLRQDDVVLLFQPIVGG